MSLARLVSQTRRKVAAVPAAEAAGEGGVQVGRHREGQSQLERDPL